MSDKKHIDRIFQEGFKDFEATPPPEVWEAVQAALKKEEKDDRKIIPIWWRIAGVAALLALLFTVGNVWWPGADGEDSFTQEEVIPADSESEQNDSETKKLLEDGVNKSSQEAIADDSNSEAENAADKDSKSPSESKYLENNALEAVADTDDSKIKSSDGNTKIDRDAIDKTLKTTRDAVAVNQGTKTVEGNAVNTEAESITKTNDAQTQIVDDKTAKDLIEGQTTTGVATENQTDNSTEKVTDPDVVNPEEGKISIFDAIKDQEEADAVAYVEQEDELDSRWSVAPQVAPVFYGEFGEGSTVSSEFADNSTSSDANLSYGVQVQYQLNKRLAVRSGVNRVNLSVNTNDIEFAVAPSAFNVGTKFVNDGISYSVGDKGTLVNRFAQAAPTEGLDLPTIDAFEGLLNQSFEYWEVPLELSYAVFDNRFKVNVFGGFSTLFLQDNSLTAISGARETNLGSVDNLNELSFTTNVGLGLQYDISKRFAINVEPVFKYQLNPYSDAAIGSQPYYMGVYSGLRFRF